MWYLIASMTLADPGGNVDSIESTLKYNIDHAECMALEKEKQSSAKQLEELLLKLGFQNARVTVRCGSAL